VMPFCMAADTYIYSQGSPTYMINIPLFNGASVGSNSTIHQKNVNSHSKAFLEIDKIVAEAKSGKYKVPSFISSPKCTEKAILYRS